MIICQCRGISDRQVEAAVERGAETLEDLARDCDAGTDCCGCHSSLEALLAERRCQIPARGNPRRLEVVGA